MSNSSLLFKRPTDVNGPAEFFIDYLTTITDGVWPVGMVFMSFALVYLSINEGPRKSYAAASFMSFIVTTLLVALGAFSSQALIIALLLVILAVVINGGRR